MYIKKIHEMLTKKAISSQELTNLYLSRISKLDQKVGSYIHITEKQAINMARGVDDKIAKGERIDVLEGIPMNLKDNISTKGIRTTAASKILANYIPPYNATVYERLQNNPLLGKVNLDEFAMGTSTETSAIKISKNPWDLTKVPGGSSGGSAASIAAQLAIFSLGTDTGGSIRQPAAFCGVVGLKPSYGLVPRYGVYSLASSLDQGGPVTRTVEDCALVFNQIKGYDPKEATSANIIDRNLRSLDGCIKGLKVGISKEMLPKEINNDILASYQKSMKLLENLGVELVEINFPHIEYGLSIYSILAYAEAASNLARYDGVRFGDRWEGEDNITSTRTQALGEEVKRRIMLGTYFLKGENYRKYYLKAKMVKELVISDFQKAFEKCHCIASPTTLNTAFAIGGKQEPHVMALNDLLTIPANLAGIPAISLPCGFDNSGLPIGLQLMADKYNEDILFLIGHNFQLNSNYHLRRPSILEGVVDIEI